MGEVWGENAAVVKVPPRRDVLLGNARRKGWLGGGCPVCLRRPAKSRNVRGNRRHSANRCRSEYIAERSPTVGAPPGGHGDFGRRWRRRVSRAPWNATASARVTAKSSPPAFGCRSTRRRSRGCSEHQVKQGAQTSVRSGGQGLRRTPLRRGRS